MKKGTLGTAGGRLRSLDMLRGLTVMLMIFVNNGAGDEIFSTLQHSRWNGMTPCDLVFPFFLFIMGISTYLSMRKSRFAWSRHMLWKIGRRTLLLFLIGLFINWFGMAVDGRPADFAHLRVMGVMQRIAICYGATALLVLVCANTLRSMRAIPAVVAVLLAVYAAILLLGGGYAYDAQANILAQVDLHVLGYDHLYHKSPVDPEGLLSSVAAVCNTLLGFYAAHLAFRRTGGVGQKALAFLLTGAVLVLAGYLLAFALPLNKRVWSPSYVCLSCGLCALLQGLLIHLVDGKTAFRGTLLLVFGTNPLFLYVVSEVLNMAFGAMGLNMAAYGALRRCIADGCWASVAYAALFTALHAAIGWPLWKRKIYIKL